MKDFTEEEVEGIIKTMHHPHNVEQKIPLRPPITKPEFPTFPKSHKDLKKSNLGNLKVKVEVVYGSTRVTLGELLELGAGHILDLEEGREGLLELYANGVRVGYGEAIEVEGRFGVRVVELE